jgi:hypothetical protein
MNTYEVHIDKLDLAGIPTTPDFELVYLKREADARIDLLRCALADIASGLDMDIDTVRAKAKRIYKETA